MTTRVLDSTVSQLLQDNSSVEYVDARENPIATTQRGGETPINELFDFNAKHNGEACIESLKPEDRGTERQFWFTVAMMCVIFECSADTIRRRVETLVNTGDINETQNCVSLTNVQAFGYNTTTLYDLTVFNKLGMTFIDNQRAVKIRAKFNDVLVKHETGVTQPEMTDAEIMSRALEIAHRTLALREERIKALTAERDEAIRTKAQIGSNREATAMATASAKSKECKRLKTENDLLTTENSRLRQDYVENKDFCKQLLAQKLVVYVEKTLRDKCSKALQELSALMEIPRLEWNEWNDKAGREVPRYAYHKDVCAELKQRIIDNPNYLKRFK